MCAHWTAYVPHTALTVTFIVTNDGKAVTNSWTDSITGCLQETGETGGGG